MVRDIAVSATETTAKTANCHAKPKPANANAAAANAPTPNHNNTKPIVKASARISTTATTSQIIQTRFSIDTLQKLHFDISIYRQRIQFPLKRERSKKGVH